MIKVMLTSGLDIDDCRPIKARNLENTASHYAATLCQKDKDHYLKYVEELAKMAGNSTRLVCTTGVRLPNDVVQTSQEFGIRPVRITIRASVIRSLVMHS